MQSLFRISEHIGQIQATSRAQVVIQTDYIQIAVDAAGIAVDSKGHADHALGRTRKFKQASEIPHAVAGWLFPVRAVAGPARFLLVGIGHVRGPAANVRIHHGLIQNRIVEADCRLAVAAALDALIDHAGVHGLFRRAVFLLLRGGIHRRRRFWRFFGRRAYGWNRREPDAGQQRGQQAARQRQRDARHIDKNARHDVSS